MKAIHLNLASRPYRDFAPVYSTAVAVAVITALLMANNIRVAYRYLVNTKETRAEIVRLESQTRDEEQALARVEAEVARVDVKGLTSKTKYINSQIADRSFSWSQLMDDLERVVPRDVRLISLNPSVDQKTGTVMLQMQLEAKTNDGLINLLKAMLANPKFENPFPQTETRAENGTHSFTVSATYLPVPGGTP